MSAEHLDSVLRNFSVSASQFHSGPLCGIVDAQMTAGRGHLHVIHQGMVDVDHAPHRTLHIIEPTVLLYPRPLSHRFRIEDQYTSHFSCATVAFSAGRNDPILQSLPAVLALPLTALPEMQATVDLLFAEAAVAGGGRQSLVDRLFEVLLIQILRKVVGDGLVSSGVLAGLAHPRIGKAVVAMHEDPARRWSLQGLADIAGMSRSQFAVAFKSALGMTCVDFLCGTRLALAQELLRGGESLKRTSTQVGYSNAVSMARAFHDRLGKSPRAWLLADRAGASALVREPALETAYPMELVVRQLDLRDANERLLLAALAAQEKLEWAERSLLRSALP